MVPTPGKRKITIERVYEASIDEIWELWTTAEGFESWWGPDGFSVKVRKLDLRVGGELLYAMTANAPDQIAFMQQAGMPLTTEARMVFTEVTPKSRLVYTHLVDFVPGVTAYNIDTVVDLQLIQNSVRMVLTLDAMHDEMWTQNAVMGWEGQLQKLDKRFAKGSPTAEGA